jgi:general secretion pathway protein D
MQYLNSHRFPSALVSVAVTTLLLGLVGTPQARAQSAASNAPANPAPKLASRGEPVTLNFANADIEAVARAMASMTGRNVVVDPRVKGTMNLNTERAVTPAVAYNLFLATIRLQGFTVVEVGGLDKVVPEADAKLQAGSVSAGPVSAGTSNNQLMTQIFKLNFEPANNLVAVLRPLISPNNTINVNPGNNSLVITDYADNLQRLARIIAALDVANATDVEILPLKYALAADLAPLVLRLVESGGSGAPAGQADTSFKTTLVPEPRSNALILRAANAARVAQVKLLVEKLDQPTQGSNGAAGNIYVVYLKNADATKLAVTLRAAMSGEARAAAAAPAAAGTQGATQASAQPSTGGQIQADPSTNSLIITAPEPQYRQLRAVIDKLDGRRAQVLVESLIAEVSTDKAAQFGIQWQALLSNTGGQNVGVLGSNFSVGGTNIFSLASAIKGGTVPPTSNGGNFGIAHQMGGSFVLGALANLLQSTGDGNVLSTPTLLTLDNEEAKFVVGQNVPFVTGQYTSNNTSNGSVNPFTTVERKDVGLTLKVKPQISEDGSVKLTIYQEVSSIQAGTLANSNGPTTNKRSIESTVLVNDGNIVVLGGLLQDDFSGNQQKVPLLGDVPVVGALFRSDSRERKKTNLMVFLRPVVVRSSADSDALSFDRYDAMRGVQQSAQPTESLTVPVDQAPVMAPIPKPKSSKPVAPPLMAPGLSGTWGSAPAAATQQDVTGSKPAAPTSAPAQ